jgi:hypothetical protein
MRCSDTPFLDHFGRSTYLDHLGGGRSLFLALCGPSLRDIASDRAECLRRHAVMAVNGAAMLIRPTYWVTVDPAKNFHQSLWLDATTTKFVRTLMFDSVVHRHLADGSTAEMHCPSDGKRATVRDMPAVMGYQTQEYVHHDRYLDDPAICWANTVMASKENGLPNCRNVMLAALKIAYTIGFRTIYLLGCDFKMTTETPYAWGGAADEAKVRHNRSSYGALSLIFAELRPHFAQRGFEVFNCNPDSLLTAFPYRSINDAVADANAEIQWH